MKRATKTLIFSLALLCCGTLFAAAAEDDIPPVNTTKMLRGLDNPCGVAVQPGTGNVFVSESGAGRVIRLSPSGHDPAITGFPKGLYGPGPKYEIGPLGLAFIGRNLLVVGGGGLAAGKDVIGVYNVAASGAPLKADAAKYRIGPWPPGPTSKTGEGNFFGIANEGIERLFFTSHGDESKEWVSAVELSNGKPGSILPLFATKEAAGVGGAVAVAVSPRGEIVVGLMGKLDKPHDSVLVFFDLQSKKMLMKLETGLNDISGLAYSPRTGWLYAIDFSWSAPQEGGLFRLDRALVNGKQGVNAVRVATLDKPTALVFAPNGALYITLFGTAKEGAKDKPGSLVRVTGKL